MKIISFTTVKDEEDIIESFVRYHMNIVDTMIIYDNCSNDNTLLILKKLKKEGLSIDIIEDDNQFFDQMSIRSFLFKYAHDKYNPDFIVPLDADEFVATYDNINPRNIIEELDKNYLYKYKMITYVIDKKDDNNDFFIPSRIKHQRSDLSNNDNTYKCFVPNNIYNDNMRLVMGCHDAYYEDNTKLTTKVLDNIFLAHFPVRNKKQITNKIIMGRLNNSSLHSRKEGHGFHQYEIFDEIIKNGVLSDEKLYYYSKYYCVNDITKISNISIKPINLSFCKNINIKYNDFNNTNLLSNTLKMSETIIDTMRDTISDKEKSLINLQKNYDELYGHYNDILNSKRWKFLSKICNIFKLK